MTNRVAPEVARLSMLPDLGAASEAPVPDGSIAACRCLDFFDLSDSEDSTVLFFFVFLDLSEFEFFFDLSDSEDLIFLFFLDFFDLSDSEAFFLDLADLSMA